MDHIGKHFPHKIQIFILKSFGWECPCCTPEWQAYKKEAGRLIELLETELEKDE